MNSIVVIDDEPLILEVVQLFLKSKGFTVHAFQSPLDVDTEWIRENCDLLICDVQLRLPKTGLEYVSDWQHQGLDCPVLIISGFVSNPDIFDPNWSFIKKPFNRRQLLLEVERLLKSTG